MVSCRFRLFLAFIAVQGTRKQVCAKKGEAGALRDLSPPLTGRDSDVTAQKDRLKDAWSEKARLQCHVRQSHYGVRK